MLAIQNTTTKFVCILGCFAMCITLPLSANAQQPSQRYKPVRSIPQVHVPAEGFRQIQNTATRSQLRQANEQQFRDPNVRPTSYTFTDQNVDVPEILAGEGSVLPSNHIPQNFSVPNLQVPPAAKDIADRAGQFRLPAVPSTPPTTQPKQSNWNPPRVAPDEINLAPIQVQAPIPRNVEAPEAPQMSPEAEADLINLRNEIQAHKEAIAAQKIALEQQQAAAANRVAEVEESARIATAERAASERRAQQQAKFAAEQEAARLAAEQEAERLAAEQEAARIDAEQHARVAAEEKQARIAAEERARVAAEKSQAMIAAEQEAARIAAEEEANRIDEEQARMVALREQMKNQIVDKTPMLRAAPSRQAPVVEEFETESNGEYVTYQEPQIDVQPVVIDTVAETVANEPIVEQQQPELSLRAPAIQVDTYGPRSIGINKVGTYKVIIRNQSNFEAENVRVGIALPTWIDVRNVNLTSGTRNMVESERSNQLSWIVPRIAANSDQTLIIDAVPTKAEKFDIGIEWTLVPRNASASVSVTEPRLEMKISGPSDVHYGEKAIYHVTVRNPGTGTAENVMVKLPEALGGERAKLYDILPGEEKNFQVELFARTAGELDLSTIAVADGDLQTAAGRKIMVRRAALDVQIQGPGMKYAGTDGKYTVTITNNGDAPARNVISAVAMPAGVKYLGGIDSVTEVEDGVNWSIGTLDEGDSRTYTLHCQLDADGNLQFDVGVRGDGDLAASNATITTVETVADLVLTVEDPKGPLPTGENVDYTIKIRNRGSRAASGVSVVMQYSKGIEPTEAEGLKYTIDSVHGQVLFSTIPQVNPGEEVTLVVRAVPEVAGTHVFRAQLTCTDSDSREVAEGTTRFYGDEIQSSGASTTANSNDGLGLDNQFQR